MSKVHRLDLNQWLDYSREIYDGYAMIMSILALGIYK